MDNTLWKKLFPFFLRLDHDLKVREAGPSIQRLIPSVVGSRFEDIGEIKRPRITTLSFSQLAEMEDQMLIFKSHELELTFKGQVIHDSADSIIITLSLWLTDIEQMSELGLKIQDFALQDPILDFLQLLKINKLTNEDLIRQTEALRKAKKRADEALEAKTNFLSIVTHEIRTPLNGIIGMTNILQEEDPKPEQGEYLDTLQFSAQHLLSLINDILDFSKLEAGKVELERQITHIPQLAHEISQTFTPTAHEKGLELRVYIAPETPKYVWTDPWRLCQVLNNLIGNALKFTSRGNVTLSIAPILNKGTQHKEFLQFTISDTGIGIPKERIAQIFEPFSQAESSTSRRFGGTGLGLTITAKLLEAMGTRMEVDSIPGQGSSFSFSLPIELAEVPDAPSNPGKDEGEEPTQAHILIVEDNPINVKILSRYLQKWDLTYDVAFNGEEALIKFQESHFDLILMDILMPEMNGYIATQEIRSLTLPHAQDIPIIALSASLFEEVIEQVKESGMNDFLNKPFKRPALKAMIRKHLSPVVGA